MRINGSNQTNFNPYKNILKKQAEVKREVNKQDQIEISKEAKQLQESERPNEKRAEYVQSIKNLVQSGEYQVDPEKTAKKMIEFWSIK
ncbi:flagellar biosynthesis anti-sigma factor FlgM [Oceanobacillus sp. Castelsardo]|uniref:flagellar biosynthesis anti-sigma factor FlgM n=1 Tax=Oceanobacillus sp. Castelsardo TaxID=1851204 RepID=UPI00083838CF|nr:flagellar biosynthesis anti-sigma factor FlgM [Oceanobacillus sp. Castelsardo]